MKIEQNKSLIDFNTFHIDTKAKLFCEVTNVDELKLALSQEEQHLILGGGSNVLFTKDFDGLVIHNNIQGIDITGEDEHNIFIRCGAGLIWHDLVLYSIDKNWGGLENLSLIPGTVGAAPMQNIGAYGVEIKNVITEVEALQIDNGKILKFANDQCHFGYRESIFKKELKNKCVITHVHLRLTKQDHKLNLSYGAILQTLEEMSVAAPTIKDVSDAVISIRQSKLPDPKVIGNAGSFFKNPTIEKAQFKGLNNKYPDMPGYEVDDAQVKVPAGWLIEQCGWKGYRRDDIGVHKNQALVLVNYGAGKGEDIVSLAMDIRKSVIEKFNIQLTPEVNFI